MNAFGEKGTPLTVTQISVFVQSRPGHLHRVLEQFAANAINVRGFSAADTGEYGIARFIVDQPERALELLKVEGYAVQATPVLCISLRDEPGALMEALNLLAERSINVVYGYSIAATCAVVAVQDIESAADVLAQSVLELLDQDAIAELAPIALVGGPSA